jgi:hypothetical protein
MRITGIDVTGHKTQLEARIIEHILKDHGEHGITDQSMRDINDIARIQHVIDNYDSMENGGTSSAYVYQNQHGRNAHAQTVVLKKKVNGTYFVVEAVPDTNKKTVFITSAYMSKGGEQKAAASLSGDAEASRFTPENATKNTAVSEDVTQVSAEGQSTNHKTYAQSEIASPSSNNNIAQGVLGVKPNESVDSGHSAQYDGSINQGGAEYGTEQAAEVYHDRVRRNASGYPGGETAALPGDGSTYADVGAQSWPVGAGNPRDVYAADSEGRTITADVAARIADTVVVDENGAPLSVYHATDNMEFEAFEDGDVGFHFGTRQQALNRSKGKGFTQGRLFRAYLNIKNPVHYRYDIMGWNPSGVALHFWGDNILSDAEYQEIMALWKPGDRYNSASAIKLREILANKGYDGIVYPNGHEGAGDSYIAFRDDQIIRSEITPLPAGNSTPANESVGAADANFTGKQAYYDLLADDNVKPGRPGDVRDVEVPETDGYGRRVSDFVTNAVGAEVTSDEMASAIEELIGEGALGFDVKSDKSLFDTAAEDIKEHGAASTMHDITTRAMKGNAKDSDIVKALLLYNIYNQKNDIDRASEIMVDLATMANDAGRKLRLFGLLRKMTPEGQAAVIRKTVERTVKRINESRSGKNPAKVTIPQELMDAYTDAARRDSYEHSEESEQAKAEAEQAIYKAAAAQIKASPMEKLNAWRYMAMLGNAKTQIRNFAGNALFRPLVSIKRAVGAAIESVALEQKDRTKAVLGFGEDAKALMQWAGEDVNSKTAQDLLSYCGQTGDAARNAIEENRQIYDTKWLEAVREFVQAVPEKADMLFKKQEYTLSLASFLKARGYTAADVQSGKVSQDVLNEGRAYAAQEALKATFNDHNFLSDGLAKMRYKGNHWAGQLFNMLGEGVMPFRRTPANIVARGMDYSPIGLVRGIGNAAFNVRSGKVSAATAIDQIAGGLTGTGMLALGWALAHGILGIRLRGHVDEEEKLSGHQSWALEIGDQSYDISWLAPANIPLLVGANLHENSAEEDNWLLNLPSSIITAFEPLLELSCLSSLNDLVESVRYANKEERMYSIAASAATNYLTQFIPTLLGQTEQAFEGEKKSVYSNADTPLQRSLEKTVGRVTQKIPGIDLFQTEKVDKWGRTQEKGAVQKAFDAFINPSKVATIEETDANRELERLRGTVPDENVYPGNFRKEISYTDSEGKTQKKELTAEEYTKLAKAQGRQSRELVEKITGMDDYKGLTDAEKAKVIKRIYEYSAAVSKSAVIEGYNEEPSYITNRAKDMSIEDAIIRQEIVGTTKLYADLPLKQAVYIKGVFDLLEKEKKADGSSYTSVRTVQKVEALAGSNLSEKQQKEVMDDILDDGAYEKYVKILAAGYDTDDYAAAYRLYQDTEKTKYTGKKEQTIRGFMKELGISRYAAQTLYDIYAGKGD